ncbi:MAG: helix-turn-helix domain-containing protein [Planctomycetes bacterium]|nr:helix-turn-helix domain-containing protein [Planctomycetota bacterium]
MSIQSVDRSLAILKLLAREKRMTATAVSERLGVHQTTASRLLLSLLKEGLVRKTDYRSFCLDYGALVFAGEALASFPLIKSSTAVCNRLAREHGLSATVAMLREGRLLYLTRTNTDLSIVLVDTTAFPVHQSSLGLLLSHALGRGEGEAVLAESLAQAGGGVAEASRLYDLAESSISPDGVLYLESFHRNRFNAALRFTAEGESLGLCLFSENESLPLEKVTPLLQNGVKDILASAK